MLMLLAAGLCPAAAAEDAPGFESLLRHGHYFLVWNAQDRSPTIELKSVGVGRYTDGLVYQVIDARSRVLVGDRIGRDECVTVSKLASSRLYLVFVEPRYNGVRVAVDRPYGIVADAKHRLGLNRPTGRVFFYVPPACAKFRVVAQSVSPREGGRVEVWDPDGKRAGSADGELDAATNIDVDVPVGGRGRVWSMQFKPPTGKGLFLDDLNVHLEGDLPCLVVPRAEWARDLIPALPPGK